MESEGGEDYFRPCGRGSTLKQCRLKSPITPGQGLGPDGGHRKCEVPEARSDLTCSRTNRELTQWDSLTWERIEGVEVEEVGGDKWSRTF